MKKKPTPIAKGNSVSKPTATKLKAYVTGHADNQQQSEVEDFIRQNPFVAEAIEGYEKHPQAIHQLSGLTKTWKMRHANPVKKRYNLLLSAGIVLISTIIFLFVLSNSPKSKSAISSHQQNDQEIAESAGRNNHQAINASSPVESTSGDQNKDATSPTLNSNQVSNESSTRINRPAADLPEKFEKIASPVIESRNVSDISRKINERSGYERLIIYLHDYKIINYAPALSEKYKEKEFIQSGIDSRFENQKDYSIRPNKLAEEIKAVSYVEFLSHTMYLFKAAEYAEAKYNFREILNYNPEDLNAYFYTGLIEFYLGNYEAATTNFILVKESTINLFAEEAEWYEALSLEKMDQAKNARELFKKIAVEKGFYATRAQSKLKNETFFEN